MSKTSSLVIKIPTEYEKEAWTDILTAITKQIDLISEDRQSGHYQAQVSVPIGSVVPYGVGDFVKDSNTTVRANGSSTNSFNYVRLGWICNVPGSPGTLQEVRALVGDSSVAAQAPFSVNPNTTSLSSIVAVTSTAYFDGPSINVGNTGTWWVSGTVTLNDTAATAAMDCKLWDGTTVIDSGRDFVQSANRAVAVALSGFITNPAGNLRISVSNASTATGQILINVTGNSKDSTISAFRIK